MDNQSNPSFSTGMSTLSQVMEIAAGRGYVAEFMITEAGLCVSGSDRYFSPDQVQIDNFYRFEGVSNPDDMAILYLIQTSDGTKGTLVDAYGTYADSRVNEFILQVQNIHKTSPSDSRG